MAIRQLILLVLGLALLAGAVAGVVTLTADDKPQRRNPGNPDTWSAATRQYVAQQHDSAAAQLDKLNTAQARAILEDLLRRYPGDYQGLNMLGRTRVVDQQWQAAYDAFARSLALRTDQPEIHLAAGGIAERHLGKLEAARKHYRTAGKLAQDEPKFPLHLANVALKLNQPDEARLAALEVLRLDASVAKAHAILAEVAARQGKLDMAIESIQRARGLAEPGGAEYTLYFLRHVEWLRRSGAAGADQALAMLLRAPDTLKRRRSYTEQLANTYQMLGDPANAAQAWADWFADHPTDAPAAAQAGLIYDRMGDAANARRYLAAARAIKPHHPLVQALAQALDRDSTSFGDP